MKKIYAILPCYNEEDNIGVLIDEWNKQTKLLNDEKYELNVIAIDDCSKDNTRQKILEKKSSYNNVDIIIHEQNRGLNGGINSALHYFNKNGQPGDLLVLMDGDNTHNPKYIHEMIKLIHKGNDCVIASRYRNGSKIVGLAKKRELMSDLAKIYYSIILKIPNVKDYTCGYRVYTYDIIDKLLKKYGDNPIKEKSFACMMELLYKVYKVGAKFDEVGFELRYDNKIGESKMRVLNTAKRSMITALKLKIEKDLIFSIICGIFLILFSVFLSLATNFSPLNVNILNHDCGIFSYIAFAMKKGRILYSEVWENKGPLLYFIYYIGFAINENYGVYLLELLSIFISVLFGYKTLKIITNKRIYSIMGIIYTFSCYGVTYEGGTFSETFALPFLFIGIYILTKHILLQTKIEKFNIIICGIVTGAVALLRLNMLSIFLAFYLIIGINLIYEKNFKDIFNWILYGIIGVAISILPMLIYFIKNNALMDCMNSAYFGILSGFDTGSTLDMLNCLKEMLITFNISGASILIFIFILLFVIFSRKITSKKNFIYAISVFLAILINLYANSIAGAYQMHYFITFLPVVLMIIGIIIHEYNKLKINQILKYIVLLVVIVVISFKGYLSYIESYNEKRVEINAQSFYVAISDYIYNNTNEDDLVQLIGGRMESVSANFRTKRLSASKYSYLPLWSTFTKERKQIMTNELVKELKNRKPKLIFICRYNGNGDEFYNLIEDKDSWDEFILSNYNLDVQSIPYYDIYVCK